MAARVENVNSEILSQCREQIGLSIDYVADKVTKRINAIESGDERPTFNQLDELAKLYKVPRWVFITEKLPDEYNFAKSIPAFRQFAKSNKNAFKDNHTRAIIAIAEQLRSLILDLRDEQEESIKEFQAPPFNSDFTSMAEEVRKWLGVGNHNLNFDGWRDRVESRGIFVFMSSKYQSWSKLNKNIFRGFSVYHERLPLIVINDSDSFRAQTFTLFHELGHIIKNETVLDEVQLHESDSEKEKWCNQFAGSALMPEQLFLEKLPPSGTISNLDDAKYVANTFKVSSYACLMRANDLRRVEPDNFKNIVAELQNYDDSQNDDDSIVAFYPSRNRSKEVIHQFGRTFSRAVVQAYQEKEIGLHKLCLIFELKRPTDALQVVEKLK